MTHFLVNDRRVGYSTTIKKNSSIIQQKNVRKTKMQVQRSSRLFCNIVVYLIALFLSFKQYLASSPPPRSLYIRLLFLLNRRRGVQRGNSSKKLQSNAQLYVIVNSCVRLCCGNSFMPLNIFLTALSNAHCM